MELRTKVDFKDFPFGINHKQNLLFFGSCFSENIGNRFKDLKFNAKINPFGIVYNPLHITQIVKRTLNKENFNADDIFLHNNAYFTFSNHSKLNSQSASKHLKKMNKLLSKTIDNLAKADCIFFTFGTAYYYYHKASNSNVVNCHKLPNKQFDKKLASVEKIVENFQECIDLISKINSKAKLIFSLSPVRHIKDGILENNISKSILRLGIDRLVQSNAHCFYLPVYELQMDELRDYRYYNEDLVHPSNLAIKIIWERISSVFFNAETESIIHKIEKYKLMKNHKVMNKNDEAYQKLKEKIKIEKNSLKDLGVKNI